MDKPGQRDARCWRSGSGLHHVRHSRLGPSIELDQVRVRRGDVLEVRLELVITADDWPLPSSLHPQHVIVAVEDVQRDEVEVSEGHEDEEGSDEDGQGPPLVLEHVHGADAVFHVGFTGCVADLHRPRLHVHTLLRASVECFFHDHVDVEVGVRERLSTLWPVLNFNVNVLSIFEDEVVSSFFTVDNATLTQN